MRELVAVLLLFLVIASLAVGLYYLVSDRGTTERTVRALTVRITLSLLLFVLMMAAVLSGG